MAKITVNRAASSSQSSSAVPADPYVFRGAAGKRLYDSQEALEKNRRIRTPFRFWIREGTHDAKITFLDGNLDETGEWFLNPTVREHSVYIGRERFEFLCPAFRSDGKDGEPCPVCLDKPAYTGAFFTVIDHTPYKTRKGELREFAVRVFVAKRRVVMRLFKIAKSQGGLAGARVHCTRLDRLETSTGETIDFQRKYPLDAIKRKYSVEREGKVYRPEPFDYEREVFVKKTPEELIAMGLGGNTPIGEEPGIVPGAGVDLGSEL